MWGAKLDMFISDFDFVEFTVKLFLKTLRRLSVFDFFFSTLCQIQSFFLSAEGFAFFTFKNAFSFHFLLQAVLLLFNLPLSFLIPKWCSILLCPFF